MNNVYKIKQKEQWYLKYNDDGTKIIDYHSFEYEDVDLHETFIWKPNESFTCRVIDKTLYRDDETNKISGCYITLVFIKKDGTDGNRRCNLTNQYRSDLTVGNYNERSREFNVNPIWYNIKPQHRKY